tara:strand:+ start:383 stop:682 length:300 start_codon:yes stop_codon:yes gene_type:complete
MHNRIRLEIGDLVNSFTASSSALVSSSTRKQMALSFFDRTARIIMYAVCNANKKVTNLGISYSHVWDSAATPSVIQNNCSGVLDNLAVYGKKELHPRSA